MLIQLSIVLSFFTTFTLYFCLFSFFCVGSCGTKVGIVIIILLSDNLIVTGRPRSEGAESPIYTQAIYHLCHTVKLSRCHLGVDLTGISRSDTLVVLGHPKSSDLRSSSIDLHVSIIFSFFANPVLNTSLTWSSVKSLFYDLAKYVPVLKTFL